MPNAAADGKGCDPQTRYRARVERYGTTYTDDGGRLTAIVDRGGLAWARLAWDGDQLRELRVPGATLSGAIIDDPLLGRAHPITVDGAVATTASAIAWAAPTEIPTLAAPGRLPPGAGGAILNALAVLAARAGVPALRYAGPYPTPALWQSLARSFATAAPEAAFTGDLIGRAARLARDPLAIEFSPAPHERVGHPHGFAELRDGLARASVDGVTYAPGGSPARLGDDGRAALWFGDAPWAEVAAFAPDGALVAGPHPLPRCTAEVVGRAFPAALVGALAELIAEVVPAPLAADAARWVAARPITWADLGARTARASPDGLRVHAALWERIAPHGLGRLALALTEALAPVVTNALLAEIVAGSLPGAHVTVAR